jgi:hypothetical protein
VVLALLPTLAVAAEGRKRRKPGPFNPADPSVELFQAIDAGQIEVKLIPKDSTQCRVRIKNKTDGPLNVKLPEAFAGVPVLAQFGAPVGGGGGGIGGGGIGGGRGGLGGGTGGMNQGFGGGMGGMGGGMGGMGGGMFNIPPERVGELNIPIVCLEHGKRDPRPKVPYEIKPIDSFTDKPEVHQLCRMLGTGRLNQRVAQVSAWHLNNDMSWRELAAKRLRFANGTSRPYFSAQEIQAGMQVVATATKLAKERQDTPAPGKSDSLSRQ